MEHSPVRREMPANLPPQYKEAENKLKTARTPEEKIAILQEMLAVMPKHKGTDHLKADIRSRISKLEKLKTTKKGQSRGDSRFIVERQGAAQVVVIGPPNCGKSSLVSALTNSPVEVADYAFTTSFPTPRMLKYEDIGIQLIDMPPIAPDFLEWWQTALIRSADLVVFVCDIGSDAVLDDTAMIVERLDGSRISLTNTPPEEKEIGRAYKPTIMVAMKKDAKDALPRLKLLEEGYSGQYPIYGASTVTLEGMDVLPGIVFGNLDIVRVYTKPPGKPADMENPVILTKGSTVTDAAKSIHKDFARNMKFTRIWGKGAFDGQRVEKDHVVEDGDILEFHA
jgi:hypothetical protein